MDPLSDIDTYSDLVATPVLPLMLGTHEGAAIPDWIGIVPNAVFATPRTCVQIQHGLLVSR